MQSLSDDLSRRRRWRNLISEENINSNEMFFHAWKTLFAICSPRSDSIMSWRDIHWHFPSHNPWLGAATHCSASRLQICCFTSHCSGLIRSLDLNLWPGVRQGQGQEGMGQGAESQEIIAPVKHSHWHYDIRANQFLHRYFRKTTSTAFLLIQTSLNCRYGSPNVAM